MERAGCVEGKNWTVSLLADMCYDPEREARTKSEKYFLNALLSRVLSFVANSRAASGGQFCAGRKTETKKLALE